MQIREKQKHQISQGKLTVLSLALASALAAMTPAHAQQTISGPSNGTIWTSGNLLIDNTGSIGSSALTGVLASGTTLGILTNEGTILNTGVFGVRNLSNSTIARISNAMYSIIDSAQTGIQNYGVIGSISNTGTISGIWGIWTGGTITDLRNDLFSTISGSDSGLKNVNYIDSILNYGTISGGKWGVYNSSNGTVSGTINSLMNQAGALLSGGTSNSGVRNETSIGSISNSGTISGAWGIYNSGSIGGVSNNVGGTIQGITTGLQNENGTITSLINAGTIAGGSVFSNSTHVAGVDNTSGLIGTLTNSGRISGYDGVINGGTINTLSNIIIGTITGNNAGINNTTTGRIDLLDNAGSIGGVYGVSNSGTIGSISNAGTGRINGSATGIANSAAGSIGAISNSGTLSGNWGLNNYGSITSLGNNSGGTIRGNFVGMANRGGASIGTLNNSGSISSSGSVGLYNAGNIGTLTNTSGALISGDNSGLQNDGGSIGSLSNSGNILGGTTTSNSTNVAGINNAGTGVIGTLSNSGTISGYHGIHNAGSIGTLSNAATITGNSGIFSSGSIGTLNNASTGVITGTNYGVRNTIAGTITLISNSGRISTTKTGISNIGFIGSINNTGSISGNLFSGISNNGGTIGAITNSGTISGKWGIYNDASSSITSLVNTNQLVGASSAIQNFGSIGTISNSGTISGTKGIYSRLSIGTLSNSGLITGTTAAIDLDTANTLSSFINTGTVAGSIRNVSSSALAIAGGTGTIFGTLTGLNGSIGNITSTHGVSFVSGNQLLNDNINVGSSTVTNAGTLQVNNPLTITGNYTQGSNANLIIGVVAPSPNPTITNHSTADTGYGRLVVTNNATLDHSTITVQSAGYALASRQRYVVVAAGGTLSATDVTYVASGYAVTAKTQGDSNLSGYTDLVLTLGGGGPNISPTTGNAIASLGGLFNYGGTNATLLAVFNPALALDTTADANKAGAQLSPTATVNAVVSASTTAFNAVQTAAGTRLDGVRLASAGGNGSGVATGESTLAPAAWGRLFGGQANQAQRDNISGYHASYGGLMLGSDVQVRDDWRVGGLLSYARTNIGNEGDNTGSSASVNSVGLTAYAGYTGNPWYLNLTAGVARQSYSTTRAISYTGFTGVANGSFNGTLYTTTAEAGYPFAMGDAVLTPLAGLRYSTLRQDGYTESGGNGAGLTVGSSTNSSLKSEIGAKFERSVTTGYGELKPFVQLGWNHEFRSTPLTTNASFTADTSGSTAFVSQGASPLRNTAALSLGATLLQGKNLSLSARYTLEGARGYTAQTGDLTVRWQY